jgi:PhnB protein
MPKLPLPPGHHTVTPGFMVNDAAKVLAFLQKAFGAKLTERYDGPGGKIMHAEVMLGDSVVMFGDAMPGYGAMPASLSYYVDDAKAVDATYRKAIDAGATSVTAPADQFYGYRTATVKDVGGNRWSICAVVEQLTPQEIQKRMASMAK